MLLRRARLKKWSHYLSMKKSTFLIFISTEIKSRSFLYSKTLLTLILYYKRFDHVDNAMHVAIGKFDYYLGTASREIALAT